jgi:hypothetical protein
MTDLATVNEAAARHAVFEYASVKAEAWETELAQFGALWREFNASFFGGALDEPHVAIGSPTSPKAWGEFTKIGGDGLRSFIVIRRTHVDGTFNQGKVPLPGQTVRFFREDHSLEARWRHLADILLHEQIHQWQYQHGSPTKQKHDVEFTAKCNEISDALGIGRVVSRRRKGDPASLPIAAHWPMNVRPDGYYLDLWGEISEPEQNEDLLTLMLTTWPKLSDGQRCDFVERSDPPVSLFCDDVTINGASIDDATASDDEEPDIRPLAERAKEARLALGASPREIAEAAGTQQAVISSLENDRWKSSPELLARVCSVLGIAQ